VIIDEAHNVLRIFEDSSSIVFTLKEVAVALSEIDYLIEVMENQDLAAGIELSPDLDIANVRLITLKIILPCIVMLGQLSSFIFTTF